LDQITITKDVVEAIMKKMEGKGEMTHLLERDADQITITKQGLKALAKRFDMELMVLEVKPSIR
jgi:hypothetical protein